MTGQRLLIHYDTADDPMQFISKNLCETISLETKTRSRIKAEATFTVFIISDYTFTMTAKRSLVNDKTQFWNSFKFYFTIHNETSHKGIVLLLQLTASTAMALARYYFINKQVAWAVQSTPKSFNNKVIEFLRKEKNSPEHYITMWVQAGLMVCSVWSGTLIRSVKVNQLQLQLIASVNIVKLIFHFAS